METITNIRTAEPQKPATFQMGIPSSFEGVVMKLLAKLPGDRYQPAAELVQDLKRIGRIGGVAV